MPRPGPRPYECVKRAWHSDRHQPMRGSIIQQIFRKMWRENGDLIVSPARRNISDIISLIRLANQAHNSTTKKNKEWQQKLPIVVLRAEQIIYSKANSEAEYRNLDTLWDRVNDAVDTIIRRDQSTETADLLPPCVEAALNLGCIPVKASRSQRYSNPRTYLTPRTQDSDSRVTNDARCPPARSGTQFNYSRPTSVSHSNPHLTQPHNNPPSFPITFDNPKSGHNRMPAPETKMPPNFGSVFPLYFGSLHRTSDSQASPQASKNADRNIVFVGTPVYTSIPKHPDMGAFSTIFSAPGNDVAGVRVEQQSQIRGAQTSKKPFESECDLSLRLGLLPDMCKRVNEDTDYGAQCADGTISRAGFKVNDTLHHKSKEFCFFPEKNRDLFMHQN